LSPPQDIPLPEEEATLNEDSSNFEPLALCDLQYDFESDHSGSDIESLSGASTTSSLQFAADLTDYLLQNDDTNQLAEAAALWEALAESWVKELPLLGPTFSVGDYTIPTWEKPVAKLESRLSAWSGRSLSLQGKTTIINVLALSQIWHLCHIFAIPAWASKRIKKALWSFLWSGKKDLVAHSTVCLPKSRGGFGVIDFERKAESFALQWVKRFFAPERAKWKSFLKFFITSCLGRSPQEAFKHIHPSRLMNALPPFYRIIFRTWRELDGDRVGDELVLQASSDTPLPVSQFSSCNTYRLGQQKRYHEPNCVLHLYGDYGPLHWPQTWAQLHITTLDHFVKDLNWKIAHGVLYTGSRLLHDFGMAHVDPQCFCRADEETLELLFFECRVARIVTGWIFFNLLQVDPTASKFTVDELLFGFTTERRRKLYGCFLR
jgi:hypothetical protein